MRSPTFLIPGAPKAGTTTLYTLLGQHPDVLMSEPKEPNFFNTEYSKGLDAYWRDHFFRWSGQRAIGDGTASYLSLPFVARRIRQDLPDAKFIVCLRNPVDRAASSWWQDYGNGVDSRPFELAILEEMIHLQAGVTFDGPDGVRLWQARRAARRVAKRTLLGMHLRDSHYAEHIRVYLDLFPLEHVKVVLFEDLVADPGAVVKGLWAFLGVDSDVPRVGRVARNVAKGRWTAALNRTSPVRRLAERLPPAVRARLRRLLDKAGERPPISPLTRRMLVEYYRGRNRELEKLVGRDLSHWDA